MTCLICKHGTTQPGGTTVTLQRGGSTILFKEVPADICSTCGEAYIKEETTQRLLNEANLIAQSGAEFDVRRYIAA